MRNTDSTDTSETPEENSLRHRRRERTWNSIHDVAYELAMKNGLRKTTTEEIAQQAGVSTRTFFNYFATKEDAVIGLREPQMTQQIIDADAARENSYIFERLVNMMLDLILAAMPRGDFQRLRAIAQEFPEVRERVKVCLNQCEILLTDFLLTVDWASFADQNRRGSFKFLPEGTEPTAEARDKAQASVVFATAVLRHINLSAGMQSLEMREKKISESVELFRTLLRTD